MAGTFLFYDFETDGADPQHSRPYQFACIRTDMDLNPVDGPEGQGITLWCRPSDDHLPAPEAVLITGITPQHAAAEGRTETDFFSEIHRRLNEPGTTSLGWNSLHFDDMICRWGFWRNFFEPYKHTYEFGCRAWDLIDLTRAAWAMRPDGIQWPLHEDGDRPTFKLDRLAPANGIEHGDAHDALADVRATIEFGRILKRAQPKLWKWALGLCETKDVETLLGSGSMLLHSTSRIPANIGCTSLMHVIGKAGKTSRDYIAWDLRHDPTELLYADAETIAHRTFTSQKNLGDQARFPLKKIKSNRSPIVLEASDAVLASIDCKRIDLDVEAAKRHHTLLSDPLVSTHLRKQLPLVWKYDDTPADDVDDALYNGFIRGRDEQLCDELHQMDPSELVSLTGRFNDRRLPDLLLHYRGRNFPNTLDETEQRRWTDRCKHRLLDPKGRRELSWPDWSAHVENLLNDAATDAERSLLTNVRDWGLELAAKLNLPEPAPID
jgi:exodeoxyribonuclease-1